MEDKYTKQEILKAIELCRDAVKCENIDDIWIFFIRHLELIHSLNNVNEKL